MKTGPNNKLMKLPKYLDIFIGSVPSIVGFILVYWAIVGFLSSWIIVIPFGIFFVLLGVSIIIRQWETSLKLLIFKIRFITGIIAGICIFIGTLFYLKYDQIFFIMFISFSILFIITNSYYLIRIKKQPI